MRNPDQLPVYHPPTTQLDRDSRLAGLVAETALFAELCRVFSRHARNCPICAPPGQAELTAT